MTVIKLFCTGCRSVSSRGFKDQKTNPGSWGGWPFFLNENRKGGENFSRFSVLDQISDGFAVSNRLQCPPQLVNISLFIYIFFILRASFFLISSISCSTREGKDEKLGKESEVKKNRNTKA